MAAVSERIEDCKDQIVGSNDPDFDRFLKGMVRAFTEILNVRVDNDPDLISIEEAE
jgi:hypothetical protein